MSSSRSLSHTALNIYNDSVAAGTPDWHHPPKKKIKKRYMTHTHTQNAFLLFAIPYRSGYLGMSWQARRTESVTRSRASVCPSLLSRRSPQSDTGSNRPAKQTHKPTEGIVKNLTLSLRPLVLPACCYLLPDKRCGPNGAAYKCTERLRWRTSARNDDSDIQSATNSLGSVTTGCYCAVQIQM